MSKTQDRVIRTTLLFLFRHDGKCHVHKPYFLHHQDKYRNDWQWWHATMTWTCQGHWPPYCQRMWYHLQVLVRRWWLFYPFCINALHNSLNGRLTEIIWVWFHCKAIHSNGTTGRLLGILYITWVVIPTSFSKHRAGGILDVCRQPMVALTLISVHISHKVNDNNLLVWWILSPS